jgi:hypothetical protein
LKTIAFEGGMGRLVAEEVKGREIRMAANTNTDITARCIQRLLCFGIIFISDSEAVGRRRCRV